MNAHFRRLNFNPWKRNISDCAIRALSIGLLMSYISICKRFGVAWKRGHGLIRDTGIDLEKIKDTFGPYFSNITDFQEEVPPELADIGDEVIQADAMLGVQSEESGITIDEFISIFSHEGNFLVGCIQPKTQNGHIVYVNTDKGYFVDTFDCGHFIVDSWMQILKTTPKDSPERLKIVDNHIVP